VESRDPGNFAELVASKIEKDDEDRKTAAR
jgi:hypothetical protein